MTGNVTETRIEAARENDQVSRVNFRLAAHRDTTSDAGSAEKRHHDLLTLREETILVHVGSGQSNKEIARDLGVTPETIKTHLKRIFLKLSAGTRAQAVARATDLGLLDPSIGDGFAQELFQFHGTHSSAPSLTR